MTEHVHDDACEAIKLDSGTWICLTEYPQLRAQVDELMPEPGDHIAVTYVADNPDGSKRFAVTVTSAETDDRSTGDRPPDDGAPDG